MAQPTDFRDVRVVRTFGPTHDRRDADPIVNEQLKLGWVLLHVSSVEGGPLFVLGWTKDEEPPRTEPEDPF
jgi:hypothetical protein